MARYIKTGTTEFEQFDGSNEMIGKYNMGPKLISITDGNPNIPVDEQRRSTICCWLKTLEGSLYIEDGDWIATGVNGEHWPVKNDIFKKTYKQVPVIPKAVATWIETCKKLGTPLLAMTDDVASVEELTPADTDQIEDWMDSLADDEFSNTIARAWLDGYEVEE